MFIHLTALGEKTKPFSVIPTTFFFLSPSSRSRGSPSLQGLGVMRGVRMSLLFQHKVPGMGIRWKRVGKSKIRRKGEKIGGMFSPQGFSPLLFFWAGVSGSISFSPASPAWDSLPTCTRAPGERRKRRKPILHPHLPWESHAGLQCPAANWACFI